jgi:hypothetical protein
MCSIGAIAWGIFLQWSQVALNNHVYSRINCYPGNNGKPFFGGKSLGPFALDKHISGGPLHIELNCNGPKLPQASVFSLGNLGQPFLVDWQLSFSFFILHFWMKVIYGEDSYKKDLKTKTSNLFEEVFNNFLILKNEISRIIKT